MRKSLMIFLAACALHTVLSAEIIPKNANGIIIWGNTPKTGYEKIHDEPLDALYRKYKIALFIPADKITAYYWEEQVFSLPLSYVESVMEDLYVEHGQGPSFFSFLIDGELIFTGVNRCRLIDSAAGIPEAHLKIPFLQNIRMFDYSKGCVFFTFSIGCINMGLFAQTFYESRKNREIYYEPLRLYFSEKKKIVEGHIDMDHLIKKGEIISITEQKIQEIMEYEYEFPTLIDESLEWDEYKKGLSHN